jgi:exodeoxyribonuclease VII small subunit
MSTKKTISELQAELQEILDEFASDDLSIDTASARYSAALKLVAQIEQQLQAAENSVQKIRADFDKPSS